MMGSDVVSDDRFTYVKFLIKPLIIIIIIIKYYYYYYLLTYLLTGLMIIKLLFL